MIVTILIATMAVNNALSTASTIMIAIVIMITITMTINTILTITSNTMLSIMTITSQYRQHHHERIAYHYQQHHRHVITMPDIISTTMVHYRNNIYASTVIRHAVRGLAHACAQALKQG